MYAIVDKELYEAMDAVIEQLPPDYRPILSLLLWRLVIREDSITTVRRWRRDHGYI